MAQQIFGDILVDVAADAWFSRDALRKEAAKATLTAPTVDPTPHVIWYPTGNINRECHKWSVEYLYSIDGARIYRRL